jgi:uncharacterized protein (TIGR02246 family)
MTADADAIVSAIIEKWSAGFARRDSTALASLYAENAFFFGSNPNLYRGRDGVKAYFDQLPRWASQRAEFSEVRAAQVSGDAVNMAATASFFLDSGNAPSLWVKITWVIVREDGDWKIASHHVSSRTPLI